MVILLDANLSWRLTNLLKPYFKEVLHVDQVGLSQPAKDIEIWEFARKSNAIIVSNDNDFYKLCVLKGFPPKVILLRTGNQSNKFLLELLIKHQDDIIDLFESNDYGLLEII